MLAPLAPTSICILNRFGAFGADLYTLFSASAPSAPICTCIFERFGTNVYTFLGVLAPSAPWARLAKSQISINNALRRGSKGEIALEIGNALIHNNFEDFPRIRLRNPRAVTPPLPPHNRNALFESGALQSRGLGSLSPAAGPLPPLCCPRASLITRLGNITKSWDPSPPSPP